MKRSEKGRLGVSLALTWTLLILAFGGHALAADESSKTSHFQITAGDATAALYEFAKQSGLQVLFPSEAIQGLSTHPVEGDLDPRDALEKMIAGTGLRFQFVDSRTVTLTVDPDRLAQTAKRAWGTPRNPKTPNLPDRRTLNGSNLQEVKVLGRSRGTQLPPGTPLISFDRDAVDATGQVTVQNVVRTLPQVFGGGPSEDTHTDSEAATNIARGYGANLRGLGAGSTLVLMNGHRLAGGGSEGIFADVSNIPIAAIERVDILPDSASTLYGGDAVAGVVNFVMRDGLDGNLTQLHYAAGSDGRLDESYVAQILGARTETSKALLAFDFYSRDNLPAAARDQARSDLTKFGGNNFDVYFSNPATLIIGNQTWAIPGGQDGTSLDPSMLVPGTQNRTNRLDHADLLPSQQRWSVFGTERLLVSHNVSVFLDALCSERKFTSADPPARASLPVPSSNPFYVNPTGGTGPMLLAYDFGDDLGASRTAGSVSTANMVAGAEAETPSLGDVTVTAGYASARQRVSFGSLDTFAVFASLADPDPSTALNPFGDGSHTNPATLAMLKDDSLLTTGSVIKDFNVTARRPIASLPGGTLMLAFGGDLRGQALESRIERGIDTNPIDSAGKREIAAAFAQVNLPLVGETSHRAGIRELTLFLAARYEHYSDFGHTLTPRYRMEWAPSQEWQLYATWSNSFRPPGLFDLQETTNTTSLFLLPDPSSEGGFSSVLIWSGHNASLRQERARSRTFGLNAQPALLPGLTLAFTYFNIDFTDRLHSQALSADMLADPRYGSIVTRNPSAQQRAAVCAAAPLTTAAGACLSFPISAIIDLRSKNTAFVQTRGIDVIGRYDRNTSRGTLRFALNGTYIDRFAESAARGLPLQNRVSTQNYPIDLRLRASAGWRLGALDADTYVNYSDDYRDTASVPHRKVSSWTTVDLNLAYTIRSDKSARIGDTTVTLTAENLLDRQPPFLNSAIGIGYDQENADLTGRIIGLDVRKRW